MLSLYSQKNLFKLFALFWSFHTTNAFYSWIRTRWNSAISSFSPFFRFCKASLFKIDDEFKKKKLTKMIVTYLVYKNYLFLYLDWKSVEILCFEKNIFSLLMVMRRFLFFLASFYFLTSKKECFFTSRFKFVRSKKVSNTSLTEGNKIFIADVS